MLATPDDLVLANAEQFLGEHELVHQLSAQRGRQEGQAHDSAPGMTNLADQGEVDQGAINRRGQRPEPGLHANRAFIDLDK